MKGLKKVISDLRTLLGPQLGSELKNYRNVIVGGLHTIAICHLDIYISRKIRQKLQLKYSQVPIKRVGPNKRVGWIFYVNFLNK